MKEVVKRGDEMEEAVKEGYLATDSEFLKKDIRGGTCCVTALVRKGDLVVSNAGDCRAVMSRGGVAEALTVDHRPSLVEERERIESLVSIPSHRVYDSIVSNSNPCLLMRFGSVCRVAMWTAATAFGECTDLSLCQGRSETAISRNGSWPSRRLRYSRLDQTASS